MYFLSRYKVLDLAVGFSMGLYLGNLVQALVKDRILPVLGLALPSLGEQARARYKTTMLSQTFSIGNFLVASITFVIIAFVIFLMVKVTKRWGIA